MTRALVATATDTLAVMDVELRALTPADVRVRVAGVGVCHSDLSMVNGTLSPSLPTGARARGSRCRHGGRRRREHGRGR